MKTSKPQSDIQTIDKHLAQTFQASVRHNPLFLGVAGLGFIAIFLFTQIGILGEPAPQLLNIGLITLLYAGAELVILALARRNKGIAANLYGSLTNAVFVVFLTVYWQGIGLIAVLLAAIAPIMALRNGLPRKYIPLLVLLIAGVVGSIIYIDANSSIERLQSTSTGAIASIVFLIATSLLIITITIISQNRRFRSLQGLLLTSFIIIVTIPTLMTAVLSALGAYTNSQAQTLDSLEAITSLKTNQIGTLLTDSQKDAKALLDDTRFSSSALDILTSNELAPLVQENLKREARARMVAVLGAQEEAYNEIMVFDTHGNVVISTIPSREGKNFQNQSFFRLGFVRFYAAFVNEPSFRYENMIVSTPIFDTNGRDMRGVLVLRSNGAAIKAIMESTAGFNEADTYLVDLNYHPVTKTHEAAALVRTKPTVDVVTKNVSIGRSTYQNYANQTVLGYYEWFQPMELVAVAEVPVSFVVANSLQALGGSSLLALFVIAIAIAAVAISARAIAEPIKALAQTTESFAAGDLSVRAAVDREDEIGALAKDYNQMAAQLQEVIGNLEKRVAARTRDLEDQGLRLRVAAEIARDAASARDLRELLTRAAELICNRFSFYHTGIFLLDNDKEFAVLVASPTEAGRQMMENNHKLRVGEMGIVGRVSATGEPRVTLDTGTDAVYFNNPYLPNTHSEMALPLKVETDIIGVLDVQSDQPEAFNEDDVAIMQILADQLATAIQRTRLLQEVERNLSELEAAYGRFTVDNWKRMSENRSASNIGYRFNNIRLEPITELPELAGEALKTGTTVNSNGSNGEKEKEHKVAVPIKLRGQSIGVVSFVLKEGYDTNTIAIVESAAERLAAAMESARLYEEARLRADREQSISRVTSAISASTEYEQILQTTVREIGNILSDTEVAIQILAEPQSGPRAEQGGR